jgi:hypothetical protein
MDDDDPTHDFYQADDGAEYYIVADSAAHCLELLKGHGFGDCLEPGDVATIKRLEPEKAATVRVYFETSDKEPRPLIEAPVGSVFSSEW